MELDFAVIGAGIAGLSAARHIAQAKGGARIAVFERTGQTGGRLVSHDLGRGRGVVELGAGRFNPVEHRRVAALVTEFGLPTKPFDFALSPLQRGLHDQSRAILSDLCAELTDYHDGLMRRDRERMSLAQAVQDSLGPVKFDYLVDMCGYDTLRSADLSFADGYQLIRHHPETCSLFGGEERKWLSLTGGFARLATALAETVEDWAEIAFDHELTEISSGHDGTGYRLCFETPTGRRLAFAQRVVLALPVWAIRNIRGLNLSPTIRNRICAVPLLKGYFAYAERWWRDMDVEGRCFSTASPFRKIYFPSDGNYLMVYCDGQSANDLHHAFVNERDLHDSFLQVIRDALPFAFGAEAIPRPVETGHRFWPHGISFWRGGMNLVPDGFWQIGQDVFICSDLFTEHLGWVEGGLASAEAAACQLRATTPRLKAAA